MAEFRPDKILQVLEAHNVRYVIVGGLAAAIHGSSSVTFDVDIVPDRGYDNLTRLSDALTVLGARVRAEGVPAGVPFAHDADSLGRVETWNLTTNAGDLDISFTPAGTRGYADLKKDALRLVIMDISTTVSSLADVIRSKEAAGRNRDRLTLPELRELLDRTDTSRNRPDGSSDRSAG